MGLQLRLNLLRSRLRDCLRHRLGLRLHLLRSHLLNRGRSGLGGALRRLLLRRLRLGLMLDLPLLHALLLCILVRQL